jgi:hypothetical protein
MLLVDEQMERFRESPVCYTSRWGKRGKNELLGLPGFDFGFHKFLFKNAHGVLMNHCIDFP